MIEKYYEEELRYLYDSGKEFARAHPDRAQMLNVDAVGDRDPYVERLFEGFAFLSARIREKLDDSFPELTEGLFNLMWPGLLHEIPSVAIVQFKPRTGQLQETRVLPRGSELLSHAVGSENTICKFTTTTDVRISPISLSNVIHNVDTRGKASLTFQLKFETGIQMKNLALSPLRIYLHAETPTALMLHEFLTRHVVSAKITSTDNTYFCDIDADTAVKPCGLSPEESILPPSPRSFNGFALLMEYFVYPDKFLFVDLTGFENLPFTENTPDLLSYTITFDRDFPPEKPFNRENFRLFCSPSANIFKKDAEPINMSGLETEYRVVADSSSPKSHCTHSVISIQGIERATGLRSEYDSLYSFPMGNTKKVRTYATHYRDAPSGKRELYITLGGDLLSANGQDNVREENLSITIYATNGFLPREEIHEGDITDPGTNFPGYVSFTNITRPTLVAQPPKNDDYLWSSVAHLSATYTTLSSPDTLKSLLRLYDWSRSEGRTRRIDAITEVSSKPVELIVDGSALRGVEFTVALTEANFFDTGDVHQFGLVLKEFLAQYVSINTFLNLVFVLRPSGTIMKWQSMDGKKCLI